MSDDPDCLGMCAIDGDVCTGCGRTLDQINAALGDDELGDDGDDGQMYRNGGPDVRLLGDAASTSTS